MDVFSFIIHQYLILRLLFQKHFWVSVWCGIRILYHILFKDHLCIILLPIKYDE